MKIATFNNVECHYDDGSIEDVNQNDLLATNNNKFKGWICWAGLQEIYIEPNGTVWRCVKRAGTPLGSIQGGFKLLEKPMPCNKKDCTCGADLLISKAKNGHLDKLRVGKDRLKK
tara:strand:- start:1140 stop:1484 length:345 start_codon:yes stop_codon:yes gene_type:complete